MNRGSVTALQIRHHPQPSVSGQRSILASQRFFDFFDDFFFGTLPPSFRASDKPIAIACFLLVTFFPDLPLLSVPSFRSCIAFLTFCCDFFPYLGMIQLSFL